MMQEHHTSAFSWLVPYCFTEKVTFLTSQLKTFGYDKCLMNITDNFPKSGAKYLGFEMTVSCMMPLESVIQCLVPFLDVLHQLVFNTVFFNAF